jgi:hypothetical protein
MTGLLAANVLYLAVGAALLPLLRLAGSWQEALARLPLAYMVGIAATGIVAAHLALIDVAIGLIELGLLAAVLLLLGWRSARRWEQRPLSWPAWPTGLVGWTGFGVVLVAVAAWIALLVRAWRLFHIRPLLEWDGWAIWAMKARALYDFGGATGPAFTSDAYPPLQHPLLLPSLEAIGFRAMGTFDPTLMHVQLLLLWVGFAAAAWALLRGVTPAPATALTLLALLSAAPVLEQLSTNQADVPLALFVALGLLGLGRWLLTDESWALVCGALFLGAATLTKSEGAMFALAAYLALAAAAFPRVRRVAIAAGATLAILLPWRLNVELRGLPIADYDFTNLVSISYLSDHSERVRPALDGLWDEIASGRWGLLVPLAVLGLVSALLSRRFALAGFAAGWAVLSFAGLVLVYWISVIPIDLALRWSGGRTVITIVVAAAALAPLLAAESFAIAAGSGTRRTPASASSRT